jgi:5-formyltetrahydrofolate cyclo-ligase
VHPAFRQSGHVPLPPAPPGSSLGAALDPTAEAVLFLVPGVAFDPRGVRLGRGDGWYDRAFARHPGGVRLGLAYEFQVLADLPEAPWDVRMHGVVTDARVIDAGAITRQHEENPR